MTIAGNVMKLAALCLIVLAQVAYGQQGPGALRWRAHEEGVIPRAHPRDNAAQVLDATDGRHLVLQFKNIPDAQQKARLEANGISLQRYLGDNAWFAHVKQGKRARGAAQQAGLHAAMRVERDWKLHPRLIRNQIPDYARIPVRVAVEEKSKQPDIDAEADLLALVLVFHPGVNLDQAGAAAVKAHGGSIRSLIRSINGATIWLPADRLNALAEEDVVQWIEPPLPPLQANNAGVRLAIQADLMSATPYELDGSGIQVMVYDAGTAMVTHPDLAGRVFARDSTSTADHPTHVAGTIGGTGLASNGTHAGVAPGVNIQSFGFEYDGTGQFLYTNPGDIEADYGKAINTYGVVIANNSIGTNVAPNGYPCEWEGDYGATDMLIDAIVRGSLGSPMRIVWANGNERGSGRCGVEYNTTAPPAGAKNHISVGAVNSNDYSMTSFSSWGPTDDGRIKPDVCAPGCQTGGDNGVTSTVTGGWYGTMCGTSMAAPAVTGAAALLLQDWSNRYPGEPLPTNALLKVMLTHNALDLGNPGPDYKFGFGVVQIRETIDFMRGGSFAQGVLDHGQEMRYFISIGSSSHPLKVTMAWDDPPGAVNTIPELVNDLDLRLISPTGTVHYPWTLNSASPSLPAVRNQPDRRNNIEQVYVDVPEIGTWTVVVQGFAIPSGPQTFSLGSTPELKTCSSAGFVTLKARKYNCNSQVTVSLKDCDLDLDPNHAETVMVQISSSSEPGGKPLLLTETSPGSATFEGSIPASTVNAPGVLQVADGDLITVTYIDADDGAGGVQVEVSDEALVDCQPPMVTNLSITAVTASSATILLSTNEPARILVRYGTACANLNLTVAYQQFGTQHSVKLTDLAKDTRYYFSIEAADEAENLVIVNNGGACYQFRTNDRRDYFTEWFSPNGFDLQYTLLSWVPAANIHSYTLCREQISGLPSKLDGATVLPLTDDWYHQVQLADGKTFPFYGVEYSSFFVGSNGYITFNMGDTDFTESFADHFNQPRISALFDDLVPPTGSITTRQLADRVVVTWNGVSEYGTTNSNTFQVVMHFDGKIEIAWLAIAAVDGLVGLSEGGGVPSDFQESDLSETDLCIGLPDKAFDPQPSHLTTDSSVVCTLTWQRGRRTTSQEVFFGPSPSQLSLVATQSDAIYPLPVLENETTYYWRVDGLNGTGRTTGDVWSFQTRSLRADFDRDGDVDMTDFAHLQLCLSGTDVPQNLPECQNAKLDSDDDVDQADVALFMGCLSGPDQPAKGDCLP